MRQSRTHSFPPVLQISWIVRHLLLAYNLAKLPSRGQKPSHCNRPPNICGARSWKPTRHLHSSRCLGSEGILRPVLSDIRKYFQSETFADDVCVVGMQIRRTVDASVGPLSRRHQRAPKRALPLLRNRCRADDLHLPCTTAGC
jgi:hypothetical protein